MAPSVSTGDGGRNVAGKVLQALSPAKPATDPDSGIFAASMA